MSEEKQIYLKNKDILAEIHNSKITYCWSKHQKYQNFDYILSDLKSFHNRKTKACPEGAINLAKAAHAARLSHAAHQIALEAWTASGGKLSTKPKIADSEVDPKKIPTANLVLRVMTWDHIPLAPGRKTNPKNPADFRAKVNFPPFKHYIMDENDEWQEVVRSHWKGTVKSGKFSVDHGHLTNRLGAMFLKLCERYSLRSNWRGYSYVEEMRGQALIQLTQIALQFDESKSQNPFAYYTAACSNSFTRILNTEKRQRDIRDDMLQEYGQAPSWTRQMEDIQQQHANIERAAALKEGSMAGAEDD